MDVPEKAAGILLNFSRTEGVMTTMVNYDVIKCLLWSIDAHNDSAEVLLPVLTALLNLVRHHSGKVTGAKNDEGQSLEPNKSFGTQTANPRRPNAEGRSRRSQGYALTTTSLIETFPKLLSGSVVAPRCSPSASSKKKDPRSCRAHLSARILRHRRPTAPCAHDFY